MEMWRDDSHDLSAAMNVCLLFRRDRHERRGGGVALYIREALNTIQFRINDDKVACLWNQQRANKADVLVSVLPCNQDEEMDELFCKHLEDVSKLTVRIHVGDFNLPNNLLGTQHSGEDAV